MNTLCHIQRTLGKPEGVEIDVVQELKFAIMSLQLKNPDCKNVTVKFCGDGTSEGTSVTYRLLINLIEDATDYDAKEKNGIIPKPNVSHIDELVKCISHCGV